MKTILLILCIVLCGLNQISATDDPIHDQSLWNNLLLKYVTNNGLLDGITTNIVNYTGFATDNDFSLWIISLQNVEVDNLTRNELYSFFTNVYNSFVVNLIVNNPCIKDIFGDCETIKSIKDIGSGSFSSEAVWALPAGTLAGKQWSLRDLERYLIYPPNKIQADPRVLSALSCGAISCPNLKNGAYQYNIIDEQFNESFANWISNTQKGMQINTPTSSVNLSRIFDWHRSLFSTGNTTAIQFILSYMYPNMTNYNWLKEHQNATISFFEYDWKVNVDGNIPCNSGSRPCYPMWAFITTIAALVLVVAIVILIIGLRIRRNKRIRSYHRINTN